MSIVQMLGRFEVHKHSFISGQRSKGGNQEFEHSHAGGSTPHEHPNCGTSQYTIDKDEWRMATGLRGGGRKKFTVRPTGENLPIEQCPEPSFDIIIDTESLKKYGDHGEGGGLYAAMRMKLGFRMKANVKII